jgi:hypothetical protein
VLADDHNCKWGEIAAVVTDGSIHLSDGSRTEDTGLGQLADWNSITATATYLEQELEVESWE